MRHLTVVLVHDVEDARGAETAEVVRLAARGRIERGAIEAHVPAIARRIGNGDGGVEGLQVGVGVVETSGHAAGSSK
jgi:hypothetical protein